MIRRPFRKSNRKKKINGWCLRYNKEVYLDKYGIGKLVYDNKVFKSDKDFLKIIL
jgi:hypothetical protein